MIYIYGELYADVESGPRRGIARPNLRQQEIIFDNKHEAEALSRVTTFTPRDLRSTEQRRAPRLTRHTLAKTIEIKHHILYLQKIYEANCISGHKLLPDQSKRLLYSSKGGGKISEGEIVNMKRLRKENMNTRKDKNFKRG